MEDVNSVTANLQERFDFARNLLVADGKKVSIILDNLQEMSRPASATSRELCLNPRASSVAPAAASKAHRRLPGRPRLAQAAESLDQAATDLRNISRLCRRAS